MNTNINQYAMKILSDAGCDIYTYGGEFSKHILDDLKTAFPDGMEYPYVDVANAILAVSRPQPIERKPFRVIWNTVNDTDGIDCDSLEEAKGLATDILIGWMIEELNGKTSATLSEEERDSWNYMIYNCYTEIYKYDPDTDEYEEFYSLSEEEEEAIGFKLIGEQ